MSHEQTQPADLVRQGYDRISGRYAEWSARCRSPQRDRLINRLLATLPAGAPVLDLGCGNGEPVARLLSQRLRVTGVDFSTAQIERARESVPGATFIEADMTTVDFPPQAFAVVLSCFSLIHVPRERHAEMLERVARWLEPGGWFICSMGVGDLAAGYDDDWLGTRMFWSNFDPTTMARLIQASGLEVVEQIVEAVDEDGTPVDFVWFVARRGAS